MNHNNDCEQLVALAREFAEQVLRPAEIALDRVADPTAVFESETFRSVMREAWQIGFHKMDLPIEVGGLGIDPITSALVHEELCCGGAGLSNGIGIAKVVASIALLRGPGELMDRFVRPFCEDKEGREVGALAIVEPAHGSDVFDLDDSALELTTHAEPDGQDFLLTGAKAGFVSNGGIASAYLVSARLEAGLGMRGSASFIVPSDLPGVSRGKPLDKLGLRCLNQAEVYFDEVRVPASYMIAKPMPDIAPMMLDAFLCTGNTFVGISAVSIMRSAFEEAVVYASERIQGGVPIATHQHIALKLFDAYKTIQSARCLLHEAIRVNHGKFPGDLPLAIAGRAHACNESVRVCEAMIQVFGGYGISREYPIEKHYRDAKLTQLEDGAVETLALMAARKLDLESARASTLGSTS